MRRVKMFIATLVISVGLVGLVGCGVKANTQSENTVSKAQFEGYLQSVEKLVEENKSLTAKVERLEDTIEVEKVANNLFIQTDNMDWDALKADVFNEKVYFDMTSVGGTAGEVTAQSIVDGWEKGFQAIESVHHQGGNMQIEVNGDTANVFLYGTATQYATTESGKNTRTFIGTYDLGLQKVDGVWKVNSFAFHLKMMDGNVNLQ